MPAKDRSHEMLVLWMNLTDAIAAYKRSGKDPASEEVVPWSSSDSAVREAWSGITAPENLKELQKQLAATTRQKKKRWIYQAIEECKARAARKPGSSHQT